MSTADNGTQSLAGPSRLMPRRKVAVGGLAGALAFVLVWVVNTFCMPSGKSIPSEVATAFTTILTFVVSYLVPEA
jgi:hypothetical protein